MNKRILLAGILAGVALFGWEAVAHMATPLGTAGFKVLPNETAASTALVATVPASGLYIFPAPKADGSAPPAGAAAGLLLFHSHGMPEMTPVQLGTQLALDIAAMLMAAVVVSQLSAGATFGMQFLIVVLLSFFTTVRSEIPLWNWYGFPKKYVAARFAIDLVGFAIAAVILPKIVRPQSKTKAAAA
jgi:hypothetical protein